MPMVRALFVVCLLIGLEGLVAVRLRGMAPGAAASKAPGGAKSGAGSGSDEPAKHQNPYFTLQPIMPTEVGQLGGIGIHQCDGTWASVIG
jgi:hypothetical protein